MAEVNLNQHDALFLTFNLFFLNEEIFVQLDELDRMTHALIGWNNSQIEAQKTF